MIQYAIWLLGTDFEIIKNKIAVKYLLDIWN